LLPCAYPLKVLVFAADMFLLGKERAKDEFDLLLASGMSFSEARAALREKERSRKEGSLAKKCDEYAAQFHTSSAGVTKEAMSLSNKGAPLAISSIKSLSAISLQRLPEARQPLSLANRVLTDAELVEVAVRRAYTSGSLDLKNRNLSTVPPKAMNTLLVQFGCLTSVNLNSNALTTLPHSFAPLCPGLTELFVSSNRLRDVPRSILQLPKVTELNLSFNRIAEVDVLQAPEMEVLRLSNNYVSSLDNMSYLRKLHSLHLDYCHMSVLTAHMKKLKHLTFLDLSHNTLVSVALPSREAVASKAAKSGAAAKTVQSAVAAVGDTREWEEVLDPFSGRTSYFCKQTKEVRRSKPPGYDAQIEKKKAKDKLQHDTVLAGALKLASIASERGDEFVPASEKARTAQADGKGLLQATVSTSTLLQVPEPIGDPWKELLDEGKCLPASCHELSQHY
jgi:hypothetical protein